MTLQVQDDQTEMFAGPSCSQSDVVHRYRGAVEPSLKNITPLETQRTKPI